MRRILEIRSLRNEVSPKLDFSTGHGQWLKECHCQTSVKTYCGVVADLIRDVSEGTMLFAEAKRKRFGR